MGKGVRQEGKGGCCQGTMTMSVFSVWVCARVCGGGGCQGLGKCLLRNSMHPAPHTPIFSLASPKPRLACQGLCKIIQNL